jgi:hypothetical protein
MATLSPEIINAAIQGFEAQKRQIDTQIAELQSLLRGAPVEEGVTPPARKGRRPMSEAGRKAIAEAQRKRWATKKSSPSEAKNPLKKKRRLSAAGRKRIAEAARDRWARLKAEKKSGGSGS